MSSDHELPCNFLEYLEWRLGQKSEPTTRMLGEWLASYEPQRPVGGPRTRELIRTRGRASKLG
jgi:hypothetical protein